MVCKTEERGQGDLLDDHDDDCDGDYDGDDDDDDNDHDDIVVTNCDIIMIIKIHYDDMHSDDPGHCVLRKAILNDDN